MKKRYYASSAWRRLAAAIKRREATNARSAVIGVATPIAFSTLITSYLDPRADQMNLGT
jgi:hypothetical protein